MKSEDCIIYKRSGLMLREIDRQYVIIHLRCDLHVLPGVLLLDQIARRARNGRLFDLAPRNHDGRALLDDQMQIVGAHAVEIN